MAKRNLDHLKATDFNIGKRVEYFDSVVSGLGLRVTPTGYRSFFYRYRYNDKIKRYTIGKFEPPALTVANARDEAKELRVRVNKGEDPQGEKQREKHRVTPKTIGELSNLFKEQYINKELKPSTQTTYKSRLGKIERKFGKYSVDELTRSEIKRFLKGIAEKHPYSANRVQAIFSKMYSFAIKEEYTQNHPLKKLEKFGEEKQRDVNYNSNEIRVIWDAFKDEREPMQSVLKMLLICGQRLGETSRMKWGDIDTENALWIIPKEETKGKKTHIVPLSGTAIDILENLHPFTGNSDFVFRSPNKDNAPLSHFGGVAKRIRQITGFENFKLHDLRHTVITGMISLGVDFVHVGKTVAHKGLGKEYVVTNRYAHYEYVEEKRKALQLWSNHLQKVLTGEETKIFKIGS